MTRFYTTSDQILAFARSFGWYSEETMIPALERANALCRGAIALESLRYEIAWSIAYQYSNTIESELFGDEDDDDLASLGDEAVDADPAEIPEFIEPSEKARILSFVRLLLGRRFDSWIRYLEIHSIDPVFTRTRLAYARNLLSWLGIADVTTTMGVSPSTFVVRSPLPEELHRFFAAVRRANRERIAGLDRFDLDVIAGRGQPRRPALAAIRELLDHRGAQCVLLLGPPGSGRTPLARHLVAALNDAFIVVPVLDLGREWNPALPWVDPLSQFLEQHLGPALGSDRWLARSILRHAARPVVVVFDGFDEFCAERGRGRLAQVLRSIYHLCDAGAHVVLTAQEDGYCDHRLVRAYLGRLAKDAESRQRLSGRESCGHVVLRIQPLSDTARRQHARRALLCAGRSETELDDFMRWLEELHIADSQMYPSALRAAGLAFLQRSAAPSKNQTLSGQSSTSASLIDLVARNGMNDEDFELVSTHLERASLAPLDTGIAMPPGGRERALLQRLSIVTLREHAGAPGELHFNFVHELYRTHFFVRKVLREIRTGDLQAGEALRRLAAAPPKRAISLCMRHFAAPDIICRIEAFLRDAQRGWPDRLEMILWHVLLTATFQPHYRLAATVESLRACLAAVARRRFFVCCTVVRSHTFLRRRGLAGRRLLPGASDVQPCAGPSFADFEAAVLTGRELAIMLESLGDRMPASPSAHYLATLDEAATEVLVGAVVAYDGAPEKSIARIIDHLEDRDRYAAFLETDMFVLEKLLSGSLQVDHLTNTGYLQQLQTAAAGPCTDAPWATRLNRLLHRIDGAIGRRPLSLATESTIPGVKGPGTVLRLSRR